MPVSLPEFIVALRILYLLLIRLKTTAVPTKRIARFGIITRSMSFTFRFDSAFASLSFDLSTFILLRYFDRHDLLMAANNSRSELRLLPYLRSVKYANRQVNR
jgi:hypothetical protein